MNLRSWVNLELSTLRPSLQRTAGALPYQEVFQGKQENHTIIDSMVYELHVVESQKVSAVNHEAPAFFESDYDENGL